MLGALASNHPSSSRFSPLWPRASAPGHGQDRIPADLNGRLLEEDWPRFEEIARNCTQRVPAMEEVKVTRLINGPEAFTPDNEFCLRESEVAGSRPGFLRPAGQAVSRVRRAG